MAGDPAGDMTGDMVGDMAVNGNGRPERPFAWVVGGAVVDDLDAPTTLLAARRTEPPHLAGGWELPGGKVDPGEDVLTALHRELAEELGVRVEVGAEVPGPDPDLPGWPLPPTHRIRVWFVRVTEGVPAPIEVHDELRVLPAGAWSDVGWLPADVPIVEALAALAGGRGAGDGGRQEGAVPGSP